MNDIKIAVLKREEARFHSEIMHRAQMIIRDIEAVAGATIRLYNMAWLMLIMLALLVIANMIVTFALLDRARAAASPAQAEVYREGNAADSERDSERGKHDLTPSPAPFDSGFHGGDPLLRLDHAAVGCLDFFHSHAAYYGASRLERQAEGGAK